MAFDIFNYGNNQARRSTTATVHQAVCLSCVGCNKSFLCGFGGTCRIFLFRFVEKGKLIWIIYITNPDEIWNTVLESRLKKAIRLPLKNVKGDYYWYILTNKMISASEAIVEELMEYPQEQHQFYLFIWKSVNIIDYNYYSWLGWF